MKIGMKYDPVRSIQTLTSWTVIVMALLLVFLPKQTKAEGSVDPKTTLRGVVMPIYQSKLGFGQSGIITSLTMEGTQIKKGEILAHIDNTVMKEKWIKSQSLLAGTQLALDKAIHEQNKVGRLRKQRVVSEMGIKEAEFSVRQAKIKLDQAKSDLRAAKKSLEECIMKAPFNGVVVSVSANLGEFVGSGAPVLKLADISRLELSTDLKPATTSTMRIGQTSNLFVGTQPVGTAQIRTILPMIDGASGLQRVIWTVSPKKGKTVTGSYVTLQYNK